LAGKSSSNGIGDGLGNAINVVIDGSITFNASDLSVSSGRRGTSTVINFFGSSTSRRIESTHVENMRAAKRRWRNSINSLSDSSKTVCD